MNGNNKSNKPELMAWLQWLESTKTLKENPLLSFLKNLL